MILYTMSLLPLSKGRFPKKVEVLTLSILSVFGQAPPPHKSWCQDSSAQPRPSQAYSSLNTQCIIWNWRILILKRKKKICSKFGKVFIINNTKAYKKHLTLEGDGPVNKCDLLQEGLD